MRLSLQSYSSPLMLQGILACEDDCLRPSRSESERSAQLCDVQQLETSINDLATQLSPENRHALQRSDPDLSVHVISILRHVPLRTLTAATGWHASHEEMQNSIQTLDAWFREEPALSRWCLWHAALVFSGFRSRHHLACWDPLCLCIASLYIQFYDQVILESSDCAVPVGPAASGSVRPIRLDCVHDQKTLQSWINDTASIPIHITGIGILRSKGDPLRIQAELHRRLVMSSNWWGISRGIAWAVDKSLNGRQPSMWHDADIPVPI
jgi:hypothetical protein